MSGLLGQWRRRRQASRAPEGALRDFLTADPPGPATTSDDLRLLAVDFETTGLNPSGDRILTIGYVPVDGPQIQLAGARHLIVAQPVEVGQSAVVHGVTDDTIAQGVPLQEALDLLLGALTGRVLLAHHADIERDFTCAASREVYGMAPHLSVVDTLTLQARVLRVDAETARQGSLRLPQARRHFGLPRYRSHQALTDALACAELYLAQVAELGGSAPVTLAGLQLPAEGTHHHG